MELTQIRKKSDFSACIIKWSKRIFAISTTKFLFKENEFFVEYKSQNEYDISA